MRAQARREVESATLALYAKSHVARGGVTRVNGAKTSACFSARRPSAGIRPGMRAGRGAAAKRAARSSAVRGRSRATRVPPARRVST